jgi:HEPN domain-containing protein
VAYVDPISASDWHAVGVARGEDAVVLSESSRDLAALYLHGFAAECYAKALVVARGGSPPPQTHDLMSLMAKAGIRREILPAELRVIADTRDVSLRYQAIWPEQLGADAVAHTERLAGFLRKQVERKLRPNGQRARRRSHTVIKGGV